MKRTNRKGFTTVELVIVIAVIAILAAVLIPTFVSLINKANQSSDIQAARAMDTALQTESAVKAPTELKEVIEILDEAGFNVDSLQPITKDCTFYWSLTLNKILLINDAEGDVIYPNKVDTKPADAQNLMDGKGFIKLEIATPEDVLAALSNGQSVTLTEDIELTAPISIPVGADVTINLNGKTLTATLAGTAKHHYAVQNNGGNVTIENGTLTSRGIMNYSGTITIKDAVINAVDINGGGCIKNKAGGEVIIDGGTFNVPNYTDWDESDKGGACAVENDGGTVIINGGTFKSNTACYLIGNLSGTMTINGGDFSAFRGTLACEGGTMIVNDGKFAVTNGDQSGWVVYTEGTGTVTINGGQFSTVTGNMFSNPEAVTDNR